MARSFLLLLAAFLVIGPDTGEAARSRFCKVDTNQKFDLDFETKPSMAVHDETMNVTFGDARQDGGEPGERLFSFRRTLSAILKSAQSPNDQRAREAFLQTMITSFTQPAAANRDSGVLMPLTSAPARPGSCRPTC